MSTLKKAMSTRTGQLLSLNILLALFIIIWGAWVRLSGSGAGCGEHWPLCHGEVVPLRPSLKTLIELTHRLTSGIFGITVLLQLIFSYREYGKDHVQVKTSWSLLVLTIIEALIGAVLVKKGLVVDNTSAMRAWVIGAHLVNTLLLMGSLCFCWQFLNLPMGLKRRELPKPQKVLMIFGLGLFLLVGAFGAITALGNTLFPSEDLISGLKSDFDSNAPFLIRLRVYHPSLAIFMGILWMTLLTLWKEREEMERVSSLGLTLIVVSLGFGIVNWLLMAPHWGALVHLFLADITWMTILTACIQRTFVIPKKIA